MKTVEEIMTRDMITVDRHSNVFEAAVAMRDKNVGFIPVIDEGRVIGTVTDRDLVIRGYAQKHPGSTPIHEVMSTSIVAVGPQTPLDEAAQLMADKQIRRLLVIDKGHLVGIVALGDLAVRHAYEASAGVALGDISEPPHSTVH